MSRSPVPCLALRRGCVPIASTPSGIEASASDDALARGKLRAHAERAIKDGEFAEAERMYRELVAKDARDETARLGLSLALLKQRKNQDAYDQAARVVAVNPLSARAHALLGTAMLNAGDFHLSVEETTTDTRTAWRGGLRWLDTESKRRFGTTYASASQTQRHEILDDIAWPDRVKRRAGGAVQAASDCRAS